MPFFFTFFRAQFRRVTILFVACSALLVCVATWTRAQESNAADFLPDLQQRLAEERLAGLVQAMDVRVNDEDFTFKGSSRVEFKNNTPDTLRQIFFHAHFNAFQPNSLTAQRSAAVGPNRLRPETFAKLQPHEIGKLEILPGTATIGGASAPFSVERVGTIIRLDLTRPLLPQESIVLKFQFEGQVPVQIRRSGRNNAQGVRYSMAQWFPKLCQYDQHGWQNNQFVVREFYGVWGKYDVKLTLPAKYVVGASGDLQNSQEVGFGYAASGDTTVVPPPDAAKAQGEKTWHFVAFPVHDFAWVADADYIHRVVKMPASSPISPGLTFHILTKPRFDGVWKHATDWLPRIFRYLGERYLPYPYKQFTCAQAGDGGMEYPNLVMVRSSSYVGTLGTTAHEAIHQWFYGIAANNETKHAWMDEGITDYLTDRILAEEFEIDEQTNDNWLESVLVPRRKDALESNRSFLRVHWLGYDEPLSIPHDRFNEDMTAVMVYRKGSAWMRQFEYSFGKDKVDELLRKYQAVWRFRHPYPPDFEKIASEVFGQRMDEVFDTFLRGVELPDYTLRSLRSEPSGDGKYKNTLQLSKRERAHVPLNLYAKNDAGATTKIHIPSDMLNAPNRDNSTLAPWFWAAGDYTAEFFTDSPVREVRLDTAGNLLRRDLLKNKVQSGALFPSLPDMRFGFMTRYDEAAPLDYYGVSVRPSAWFDPLGGAQIGLRLDGFGDYASPKITAGAYYNIGNGRFDWQLGMRETIGGGGAISTADLRVFSMDGVTGVSLRGANDIRPVRFAREDFTVQSLNTDVWLVNDPSYYTVESGAQTSEIFTRFGAVVEKRWRTGAFQFESNVAATVRDNLLVAGAQLRAEWREKLLDLPFFSIEPRAFAYIATDGAPDAIRYSLQSGTMMERFENVPSRFTRFAAYNAGLPVFTPGGGGLVRADDELQPFIVAASVSLGNKTLRSMGVNVPVVAALKPIVYAAGAFSNPTLVRGQFEYLSFDSGVALSVNLADIAPESRLLWMFRDDVSLTAFVPLASFVLSKGWVVGYDGVRIGVSTTILR
jgi:hypothetical protein